MRQTWFADIEDRVFTYNKYNLTKRDGAEFPSLFCTSDDLNDLPSSFPALLVHEISQEETGQDLDNEDVNAVRSTFECRVFSETNEECKAISAAQSLLMKRLRFNAVSLPIFIMTRNIHVSIARYRRVIGAGDTLIPAE